MSIQPRELPMSTVAGPREHFDDFCRHEYPRAAQLAWLLTHGHNNEDLAQDAFITVQSKHPKLDNPSAYLTTAVVNRCRSWHRREQRRRLMFAAAPPEATRGGNPVDEYLLDAIEGLRTSSGS